MKVSYCNENGKVIFFWGGEGRVKMKSNISLGKKVPPAMFVETISAPGLKSSLGVDRACTSTQSTLFIISLSVGTYTLGTFPRTNTYVIDNI